MRSVYQLWDLSFVWYSWFTFHFFVASAVLLLTCLHISAVEKSTQACCEPNINWWYVNTVWRVGYIPQSFASSMLYRSHSVQRKCKDGILNCFRANKPLGFIQNTVLTYIILKWNFTAFLQSKKPRANNESLIVSSVNSLWQFPSVFSLFNPKEPIHFSWFNAKNKNPYETCDLDRKFCFPIGKSTSSEIIMIKNMRDTPLMIRKTAQRNLCIIKLDVRNEYNDNTRQWPE